jgi:hypothetical protein
MASNQYTMAGGVTSEGSGQPAGAVKNPRDSSAMLPRNPEDAADNTDLLKSEGNNPRPLEHPKVRQPAVRGPNKWKVKHETLRRNKLLGIIDINYVFSSPAPSYARTKVNVALSSSQCSRIENCGGKGLIIVGSHNFVRGSGRSRVEQQLAQDFARRRRDSYGKDPPPDDEAELITDLLESLQKLAEETVFIDQDS